MFVHPKRKHASRGPKGHRWGENECVQHLSSEETPASTAELPAPEPNFPTAVSTASGKNAVVTINFGDL